MGKRTVFVWAIILGILMFAGVSYAADKFAYVDLTKIFSEYSKTKDYDKVLGDKQSAYEGERDKMVGDIKSFQDKMNLLSDKEKEAKKGDLEDKVKKLQEFDRQKQTDLRKEQDEKMKELLKDINDTIKGYAEKEGYTLIFNDRVLVYQDKSMDITDKIVELINKNSPKAGKK
jgi:outer membrane protein